MRFSMKTVYALAVVVVLIIAQAAFAQRGRSGPEPAGWLGVSIQDVTEDLREALPRNVESGALINNVSEDSPADEAGLMEGDVVVGVDREDITDSDDLTRAVREAGAGASVRVEFYRNGRRKTTTVELGDATDGYDRRDLRRSERKRPGRRAYNRAKDHMGDALKFFDKENGLHEFNMMLFESSKPRLGVHLMDPGDQLADYFGMSSTGGTLVTEVEEDSPAQSGGIQAGDIITGLDDREISDADGLRKALRRYDEGGDVTVKIVRKGRNQSLVVSLEEVEEPKHHSFMAPDVRSPSMPRFNVRSERWRDEMKELREEMKELKRELSDIKSDLR